MVKKIPRNILFNVFSNAIVQFTKQSLLQGLREDWFLTHIKTRLREEREQRLDPSTRYTISAKDLYEFDGKGQIAGVQCVRATNQRPHQRHKNGWWAEDYYQTQTRKSQNEEGTHQVVGQKGGIDTTLHGVGTPPSEEVCVWYVLDAQTERKVYRRHKQFKGQVPQVRQL